MEPNCINELAKSTSEKHLNQIEKEENQALSGCCLSIWHHARDIAYYAGREACRVVLLLPCRALLLSIHLAAVIITCGCHLKAREAFRTSAKLFGCTLLRATIGAPVQIITSLFSREIAARFDLVMDQQIENFQPPSSRTSSYGPVENNQIEIVAPRNSENGDVYIGERLQGKKHGQGRCIYANGDTYEGEWFEDEMHGQGTYTYANGAIYVGQSFKDKMHGQGTYTYANGDTYEGQWSENLRHGKGRYTQKANGTIYDGEWKDDNQHGQGTCVYGNGDFYEGQWANDLRHGQGKCTYANKVVYEGQWAEDKKHGQGKWIYANGSIYEGLFSENLRHGQGKLIYADGAIYEGQWFENKRHGKGTFTAKGTIYEGEWAEDKIHGHGKFINGPRGTYEGEWVANKIHGLGEFGDESLRTRGRFSQHFFQSDRSYLTDLRFLRLLVGSPVRINPPEYALGILSDYLCHTEAYKQLGKTLKFANELFQSELPSREKALKILDSEKREEPVVLLLHSLDHAMGLRILKGDHAQSVFLDLFNSGAGIYRWHPQNRSKFQTQLRIKVPIEFLTSARMELFFNDFSDADHIYETIRSIPGAEIVPQNEDSAVWQTKQKRDNCTLEWIFAFLRNSLSKEEYDRLRIGLFNDCLKRIQETNQKGPEIEEIVTILNQKIEKRNNSLSASTNASHPLK